MTASRDPWKPREARPWTAEEERDARAWVANPINYGSAPSGGPTPTNSSSTCCAARRAARTACTGRDRARPQRYGTNRHGVTREDPAVEHAAHQFRRPAAAFRLEAGSACPARSDEFGARCHGSSCRVADVSEADFPLFML
jgi:hypothetical protein